MKFRSCLEVTGNALKHSDKKSGTNADLRTRMSMEAFAQIKAFHFEAEAMGPIREISMHHHKDWASLVMAPFEDTWLEWQSDALLMNYEKNPDFNYGKAKTAAWIRNKIVWFMLSDQTGKLALLPFGLVLDDPANMPHYINKLDGSGPHPDIRVNDEFLTNYVWGKNYFKTFGEYPPFPVVWVAKPIDDSVKGYDPRHAICDWPWNPSGYIRVSDVVEEYAGICRHVCVLLAYMNTKRAVEIVDMPGAKKHTFHDGKVRPFPKQNLVVIRPDSVRTVVRYAHTRNMPVHEKRHHEVRRHFRTYKSGKRVPVREHWRGNEELGTVQKRYIVEPQPETFDDA